MLSRVRPLREVRVWSPRESSRAQFVADTSGHTSATVTAAATAEDAVRGADLVVVVTSSPTPVLADAWVSPGAHVMAIGACRPDQRELDPALVARSRLVVDSRAAALVESGDVALAIGEGRFTAAHVLGELGDVVRGTITARRSDDDVTVFKSLGLAVEDVAAADLVYRRALAVGGGTDHVL